ncbi:DUF1934 domain-containing protein [Peribacillus kribbensis]|uniref:DUF1934 domain-containing protein n=1 Tax=Peribacillus kribbensis TaxID=356658 RepID=UPI0003FC287E|nr:DUF1934 domain-containing protein [Peribacillus kribbensis]
MNRTDSEKKNVKITVKTTITNDGDSETFELKTSGVLHSKASADYLQYEEHDENGKIQTLVKFNDTDVMLKRSGSVKMKQNFHEAETTNGYYESMYGRLLMETNTQKIVREWDSVQREGLIRLLYRLNMQGNSLGTYLMEITYREEA